ncbi:MAG: sigma-54-dependent Fis family transcriptional regulator [candidate division Zixibacteria bacterium]|nr:sigma-54-dependent Fis family transcriptional regulator [candidate division Zixibacteria bacterium]
MQGTKLDRTRRTVVLLDPSTPNDRGIAWDRIGQSCTELAELYQTVKESRVDLILVDENRTDLTRAVATRIRRHNGLTDIWKLSGDGSPLEPEPDYIDGVLAGETGPDGLIGRVDHILRVKDLLGRYRLVGRSTRMKAMAEIIERVAVTDMAVLIVGASGSGKELVAQALHGNSSRNGNPFVALNCGALAEGVLESELFGHEKGAFTGSVARREGLFHKADGGTIFLDEIGETRADTQVKLLRVLEDGTYYPVGSSTVHRANVRVISATNRDLTEAIADREFREDLYFRIAVVKIMLPPLLERKGDIQPLLHHFWKDSPALSYSDSALDLLMRYDWPGNVRQLRNFTERMIALKGKGLVDVADVQAFIDEQYTGATHLPVSTGKTVEEAGQELIYRAILSLGNEIRMLRDLITAHLPGESPPDGYGAEETPDIGTVSLERMEEEMIRRVLDETRGNRKETARLLGIGERTLYRKLKKYRLS